MKVSTVAEMRALDRTALDQFGIPEEILMENAGAATYRVLARRFPIRDHTFLIFCGSGNNGGDGLVVARHIHAGSGRARVMVMSDPARYIGAGQNEF